VYLVMVAQVQVLVSPEQQLIMLAAAVEVDQHKALVEAQAAQVAVVTELLQ
jgi:hypothetical protein